jgi:hypothetical protein
MKNINVVFDTFDTKACALYDKELALNNKLIDIVAMTVADITILHKKYSFKTNLIQLISYIELTSDRNTDYLLDKNKESLVRSLIEADVDHPKYKMLAFKVRILIISNVRLFHNTNRLAYYKSLKMPYLSFNYLNTAINNEMSKSILRGYDFNLGIGEVKIGVIGIDKIERKFDETGLPTDRSIDWGESNKFKKTLIEQGIEPYNKETAPNGKHWFLYHTEPYIYYINWRISMYAHRLIKFFKFDPNSFINTKNRLISDVLDEYNTDSEDIINNSKLGFSNKLNILLKHDPSYALKFE